jgi:NUMOD4 motif-containing protein
MEEAWIPLQDYPGYSISNWGRVRNDKRSTLLSIVRTQSRHTYVSLMKEGIQVSRSVAKIVAESFVDNPRPTQFTTPIHLNGDLSNSRADNLLWRPRWFAMRFTQQFGVKPIEHLPIRNKRTGEEFETCWPLVTTYGLLYMDIILATSNFTYVYPTMQTFEWVI